MITPANGAQTDGIHPDDLAVDRFAAAMKAKLAAARAKGRSGWDDPAQCSVEYLASLLIEHISKGNSGNFEDIANLAMMLHQRDAEPDVLARVNGAIEHDRSHDTTTATAEPNNKPALCSACFGKGYYPGVYERHTCSYCNGSGRYTVRGGE